MGEGCILGFFTIPPPVWVLSGRRNRFWGALFAKPKAAGTAGGFSVHDALLNLTKVPPGWLRDP